MDGRGKTSLEFERSARRESWVWAMLLLGVMFLFAAHTVDPLKNCDGAGNCGPWLVPIAGLVGVSATAMAIGLLIANPSRGRRIDPATGDLVWWKNRTARSDGASGRIHPAKVASIGLILRGKYDSLSLYGDDGERLAHFDEELVPWPHEDWAERFQRAYPHVRMSASIGGADVVDAINKRIKRIYGSAAKLTPEAGAPSGCGGPPRRPDLRR